MSPIIPKEWHDWILQNILSEPYKRDACGSQDQSPLETHHRCTGEAAAPLGEDHLMPGATWPGEDHLMPGATWP